jgi:hypothetical protein
MKMRRDRLGEGVFASTRPHFWAISPSHLTSGRQDWSELTRVDSVSRARRRLFSLRSV